MHDTKCGINSLMVVNKVIFIPVHVTYWVLHIILFHLRTDCIAVYGSKFNVR